MLKRGPAKQKGPPEKQEKGIAILKVGKLEMGPCKVERGLAIFKMGPAEQKEGLAMFERVPCKVEKGACKAERGRVGSFLFVDLVVNVRQDCS